jgi:hypothetical protein
MHLEIHISSVCARLYICQSQHKHIMNQLQYNIIYAVLELHTLSVCDNRNLILSKIAILPYDIYMYNVVLS